MRTVLDRPRTPPHEVRFRFISLAVVLVVVAGVAAYVVLSGRQKRDVPVPADSATPEQVVTAYLRALDARDCGTANRLTTTPAVNDCDAYASVHRIRTTRAVIAPNGLEAGVDATYDVSFRLFTQDTGGEQGPTSWTFALERTGADAPWRISTSGGGQG